MDLFPDAPSSGYKHLKEYGNFATVSGKYDEPIDACRSTVKQSLSFEQESGLQANFIEALTYCFDGHFTQRAVETLLSQIVISRDS